MLENGSRKIDSGQGPGLSLVGLAIPISKGNLSVLMGENVLFRDHPPVQIPGEIFLISMPSGISIDPGNGYKVPVGVGMLPPAPRSAHGDGSPTDGCGYAGRR